MKQQTLLNTNLGRELLNDIEQFYKEHTLKT